MILQEQGLKSALRDGQVWVLLLITALPIAIYEIDGIYISKYLDLQYDLWFFPNLWTDPGFYVRWKNLIGNTLGFGPFPLALLGIYLAKPGKDRALLLGTFLGYLAFGFAFSYHISTHNYYHLQLFVFISLSLAVVGKALFQRLREINVGNVSARLFVIGAILFGIGSEAYVVGSHEFYLSYALQNQKCKSRDDI